MSNIEAEVHGRTFESADHARDRTAMACELYVAWIELDAMSNTYICPASEDMATREPSGLCNDSGELSVTLTHAHTTATESDCTGEANRDTNSSLRITHMFAEHPKLATTAVQRCAPLAERLWFCGVDCDVAGATCRCVRSSSWVQGYRPCCERQQDRENTDEINCEMN